MAAYKVTLTLFFNAVLMMCISEPERFHLIKTVVPRITTEWEDVAYALDYDIYTVEYIKCRNHNDPRECCKDLFENWLTTNNGAKPKTWSTLLEKVGEVNELALARKEIIKDLETAEMPQSSAVLSSVPLRSTVLSFGKWLAMYIISI